MTLRRATRSTRRARGATRRSRGRHDSMRPPRVKPREQQVEARIYEGKGPPGLRGKVVAHAVTGEYF